MIDIDVFEITDPVSPDDVNDLLHLVSDQRREEALRHKHLFGQFASLKSYVMLRKALESQGLSHPFLFDKNEHGKPFLRDHPEFHFNISHCKRGVAVAVADTPIGIDIESFRNPSERLLRHTMNNDELRVISESDDPTRTFTEYWTKKEAVFKLHGTGILRERLHELLNDDHVKVVTYTNPEKRYAYSVATKKEGD